MPETIKDKFFASPTPMEIFNRLDLLDAAVAKKAGAIDAKGYGVTGNGMTSDSGKIQELLDLAIPAAAAVEIYFPPGKYRLTNELKIYSNTKITASPAAIFVRDHSGYLMMNGNRSTESNPTNAPGYTGRGNLQIIGGTWDGNGTNQPSKASIFFLGHADRITFMFAVLKDVATSHHIEFNGCQNVIVEHSFFLGTAGMIASNQTFNEAIQLDLPKNEGTTIGPNDNTPCKNVYINNCYFGPSGTPGTASIGRAVGSHSATTGRPHFNINITNCMIEEAVSFALRAYNWRNVNITNNFLYNCAAGINWRSAMDGGADSLNASGVQAGVDPAYMANISKNTIQATAPMSRAIEIYGETGTPGVARDINVSDNIIRLAASEREVILFHYCESCRFTGNRVHGSGTTMVVLRASSTDIEVNNNVLSKSGGHGISVSEGCTAVTVSGNKIRETNDNGIYVGDSTTGGVVISGNVITGVNGKGDASGSAINHIRMTSAVKGVAITGNIFRNIPGFTTGFGVYVTNTCEDVSTSGNSMTGLKLYNGSILSSGMTRDTSGDVRAT